MPAPLIAALVFSVALLVTTAYFLMGSVPLLVLQHDTPMDARFVRGFYAVYCRAAVVTAGGTSVCYALAGRRWPPSAARTCWPSGSTCCSWWRSSGA